MKKTYLSIILYFLAICIPNLSFSLTFKSDGSVISSSGKLIKDSYAMRYQKALNDFNQGLQISSDYWPTVKYDEKGKPVKVPGYFGEDFLKEGAPLLNISNVKDFNKKSLMDNISKNNGFSNIDNFNDVLIDISNKKFLAKDPQFFNEKLNQEKFTKDVIIKKEKYFKNLVEKKILEKPFSKKEFDKSEFYSKEDSKK